MVPQRFSSLLRMMGKLPNGLIWQTLNFHHNEGWLLGDSGLCNRN